MIKRNSPKVTMVTGRVKITNMGLTNIFSRLRTTATITAVMKESTLTFGNTFAKIITANALKSIRTNSFIGVVLQVRYYYFLSITILDITISIPRFHYLS